MNLKGDLRLLYEELNSLDPEVKKDALKKTIVYMSVGRDVSEIFQTVIRCLEINDIEMKKLIYLYIVNYSQSRPKDAIMVINQFCRVAFVHEDVDKKNNNKPLIRALAFRTMGCLRVKELNEYLITPLLDGTLGSAGLRDGNSYVRKTAVMCVPKIYEITPELVDRTDAVQILKDIFERDGNSQVVANAAQALAELSVLRCALVTQQEEAHRVEPEDPRPHHRLPQRHLRVGTGLPARPPQRLPRSHRGRRRAVRPAHPASSTASSPDSPTSTPPSSSRLSAPSSASCTCSPNPCATRSARSSPTR